MTNGEKIIEIVGKKPLIDTFSNPYILFNKNWWNAEYKELSTKNDLADKEHEGEVMDFPNTFDEFAKDYGFKDKDEIYTNGSELIPVFRVKQWLEHISTTENDSKFCPDRKAKTTHAEGFLPCMKNECAAYKDGRCLKYNSNQESTTKNDLEVEKIIDEIEEEFEKVDIPIIDKLTLFAKVQNSLYRCAELRKASEDAYNKGYADGIKSVNICPYCGEYIGEEE